MSLLPSQPFAKKLIAVIRAREGMSLEEFRQHYEGPHAALLRESFDDEITAGRVLYRRNYLAPIADELSLRPLAEGDAHVGRPFARSENLVRRPLEEVGADDPLRVGCVTELGFRLEADYTAFMAKASEPTYVRRSHEAMAAHVAPGSPQVRLVECWDSRTASDVYTDDEVYVRLFGLVPRKANLSLSRFIAHYEGQHIKVVGDLMEDEIRSGSVIYRRNYVLPTDDSGRHEVWTAAGSAGVAFSCLTELAFRTKADHDKFRQAFADPAFKRNRDEDEERYKDPSGTLVYSARSRSR